MIPFKYLGHEHMMLFDIATTRIEDFNDTLVVE